eukprot:2670542-Heterocapsa_arctica.AAC.1
MALCSSPWATTCLRPSPMTAEELVIGNCSRSFGEGLPFNSRVASGGDDAMWKRSAIRRMKILAWPTWASWGRASA